MRTIKEEEVDVSDDENYAQGVSQLGHFLDEVYTRQQHSFFLGLSHSRRV
jgi:hypothetical protein